MDYYDHMRRLFLSFFLISSLSLQAQTVPATEPVNPSSALDSTLFYQLLLGELNARSDDVAAAFSLVLDAARKTSDPLVYRRAIQIALQARSGESALIAAKAWSTAIPTSREANNFVLQILLGLNRVNETLEPLKRELLLVPAPEKRAAIWVLPSLFERTSDKTAGAQTLQKALAPLLAHAEFGSTSWAVIGRMWQRAGEKSVALKAASQGLGLNPQDEHPALVALSLMSEDQPEAENWVKKHLDGNARAEFRMAYVKALLAQKRDADAQIELNKLNQLHPDYADAWLVQGALSLQNKQFNLAEQQLQHFLALSQKTAQTPDASRSASKAYLSLAHIANLRKDFQQADSWLQRIVHADDILDAQIRRAGLLSRQGQLDQALTLIQNAPERSVAEASTKRSAQLQLLREHKQYKRANALLMQALTDAPHDTDLIYEQATLYEKLGDLPEMERLLRQLIALKPADQTAYNALGYALADHNQRLPEARALIAKALELAPGDPFIIDSLAWVEFRMGQSAQALRLLQGAYAQRPDAEIAAHLGEVLWSLDLKLEAQKIWREGMQLNPDNETLVQTLKRLGVRL
jgi:tetratricopeptide (TPR) repeat protein